MNQQIAAAKLETVPVRKSRYEPALDGLRVLAFGLVLFHHLPRYDGVATLEMLNSYGWVGVELFFVISSYLFFTLFQAEEAKDGRIAIGHFYIRRLLRIYPLMVAFPTLMIFMYGKWDQESFIRWASIAMFADNLMTLMKGYNVAIPLSTHLWTLSFEFQVYIFIPAAYLVYRAVGLRKFLIGLLIFSVFCLVLRALFAYGGALHPSIWVTPLLRPDSVLLGLALAIGKPRWHWSISLVVAIAAGAIFTSQPLPWMAPWSSVTQYPTAAIMCAAFIDAVLRCPALHACFSWKPLRPLGTVSFGLYVYHFWGIRSAAHTLQWLGINAESSGLPVYYPCLTLTTIAITVAVSAVSYRLLEKPFAKVKMRFTAVDGRASAS